MNQTKDFAGQYVPCVECNTYQIPEMTFPLDAINTHLRICGVCERSRRDREAARAQGNLFTEQKTLF